VIRYEPSGDGVVVVTIDRPECRNALDLKHIHDLAAAWLRAADDVNARVVVLTGAAGMFCAGADLRDATALTEASLPRADRGEVLSATDRAFLRGVDFPKPIVAAVDGVCFGAGMDILSATDIRFATESAVFGALEPRRGLMAAGGTTALLPRQLCWPAAMEILLMADKFPASRALELGLVNKVVPSDDLAEVALSAAKVIAQCSPAAIRATKASARASLAAPSLNDAFAAESQIFTGLRNGPDATEGVAAFLERREPVWPL
jgi:enoyl-CoA hydratase